MSCPFCEIDKEKTRIVHEGKSVRVILSNPRLMSGHLLVIPKRHVERLSELGSEERKELFEVAVKFQDKILEKFASGCDIRQNCRPFQKESRLKVNHVHIHLQPREFEDELYEKSQIFEKGVFGELTGEEKNYFMELFKEE